MLGRPGSAVPSGGAAGPGGPVSVDRRVHPPRLGPRIASGPGLRLRGLRVEPGVGDPVSAPRLSEFKPCTDGHQVRRPQASRALGSKRHAGASGHSGRSRPGPRPAAESA